jgi:hypothetical protein
LLIYETCYIYAATVRTVEQVRFNDDYRIDMLQDVLAVDIALHPFCVCHAATCRVMEQVRLESIRLQDHYLIDMQQAIVLASYVLSLSGVKDDYRTDMGQNALAVSIVLESS